ncbi:ComEA family DNA-binding protein [Sinomicrobium soli]|uniref:ComEA family DNA-binding protein n=1 Tax=Sinomicrobium sp. N-1-3-6 TaxID=2219864 RepID=UPI001374D6E1|nr:helix-hairpin-helix domain-containing protein [Sinomicrobium sp. N-1-3-6]
MTLRKAQSRFRFDQKERNGIFFLLVFILLLQPVFLGMERAFLIMAPEGTAGPDTTGIDDYAVYAGKYTYNPNFLTDYRGYVLGMTTEEIDRLHRFRSEGAYVADIREFARVTGMEKERSWKMEPYLRFPEKKAKESFYRAPVSGEREYLEKADLNLADEIALDRVYGIGETLSRRIVKYRRLLGGFSLDEQLFEVYGLDSVAARRVLERFEVRSVPRIRKLDINKVSVSELQSLAYLNREEAMKIVAYRTVAGHVKSVDELRKIEDFPPAKIDRIKLYLTAEP